MKANTQYGKFLEAIRENETFISNKRESYNFQVKEYNSEIAQIPMVFVASLLGFKQAPFFDPNNEEALAEFSGADPEAQAKREERLKQEREGGSNDESVKTEEKTDTEVPKADVPTAEILKTNDVSSSVEKKEDK